jgi:hypothetical protein
MAFHFKYKQIIKLDFFKLKFQYILFTLSFFSFETFGQQDLSNGFYFPVHNKDVPLHALVVCVELRGGKCDEGKNASCFKQGELPENIDDYFDPELNVGGPEKYFTKYLYQASFGQFVVLGDYLDNVVYVDYCPESNPSNNSWAERINAAIRKQFGDSLPLHHSTPLDKFDQYDLDNGNIAGVLKSPQKNGNFDCLVYLVKNYPVFSGYAGYGLNMIGSSRELIGNMGVDVGGVFGHTGDVGSIKFIMEEFFHAMYGGNNWHDGAGKSNHTFLAHTRPWGIPSQHGMSQVVTAYDRWIFKWNNPPDKKLFISARNENNEEVDADLKLQTGITEQEFILRDFVTTGDALRIKLPHIENGKTGPEKNQYMWLENHQLFETSVEDQNANYTLSNTPFCNPYPVCGEFWSPGLFAIMQVGKDITTGSNIYYSGKDHPNALASWLYPLTAEGNFDFNYSDVIHPPWSPCTGMVPYVLFDFRKSPLQNPFSGFSTIFGQPNTNNSDMLFDRDAIQGVGFISEKGDTVLNRSAFGGTKTSFNCKDDCPPEGKKILSLSTNPSAVPLLTYTSGDNFLSAMKTDVNKYSQYENRTIYLNGLSITILENNFDSLRFGKGAIKVRVKWNDYIVANDVRWCADSIRLNANDFDAGSYSLVIKENASVLIDRGKSPTYDFSDKIRNGFTVPTVFSCLENSKINIEAGGELIIDNGSLFELNANSKLDIARKGKIIVKNGGVLKLKSGSQINISRKGKIVFENGGMLKRDDGAVIQGKIK